MLLTKHFLHLIDFIRFFDNFKGILVAQWKVDKLPLVTSINNEYILSCSSCHSTDTAGSTPAVFMPNL